MISQIQLVIQAISDIAAPGIVFEQSMADLSSITGTVGEDLKELAKVARQTGVESGLGADQAARAFAVLASQIEVGDIGLEGLKELQRNAITLSHAAGITMDEAANALAGTINQYGLEAGEAARVINVLAAGSKYGAAEIGDLARSFKVVGAQASIAGLSVEDTAGAIEVLSKNNIKGEEAGTNLRNIILAMQTTLGVDFSKTSLSEALDALKPRLNDAAFMSQTFGRMSMASAQFLVQNAGAVAEMTEKVTATDTAMEQAATRTETVGQTMARCRAFVDNLKIGFFNFTGVVGVGATVLAEQGVLIAQLMPLFGLMGKAMGFVTNAQKLQALWTGAVSAATSVWTGVQWALNTSLYGCPVVWLVAGIAALVAAITVCVTKVQGWGAQWNSVVNFMKLGLQLWVETIKYRWNTMIDGLMIGLDYIRLGWYKFREAVGLGDSAENQEMISAISADIERRKDEIVEGAKKLKELAAETRESLTWELSWKKREGAEAKDPLGLGGKPVSVPVVPELADGAGGGAGLSGGVGSGGGRGSSGPIDLNRIVPNLKGSTAYSAIARRLAPVAMAAASAMPLTVAATTIPQDAGAVGQSYAQSDFPAAGGGRGAVSMGKFCDNVVIHVANTDGHGREQIRREVMKALEQIIDNHEA